MPKVKTKEEGVVQQSYEVKGTKILVFGDLHLSATYQGEHKAYLYECYRNMETIRNRVKDTRPCAIIFEGDLIGVTERNLKDRQFLMRVLMFFSDLNEVTNGNVFTVKGNHDVGDFSDFDFLIGLGLIKNPRYVDFYGVDSDKNSNLEVRFHFVNWGEEGRKLDLLKDEDLVSNIVIGHNDYYIEGVTNWYSSKAGVKLKSLKNFKGVDIIFSGHIHTASDEILYTDIDGERIGLVYTGSPSRTAERVDDCIYITVSYGNHDGDDWYTSFDENLFGLQPASEVFYEKEVILGEEENSEEERSKVLIELVNDILESQLSGGDLFSQVRCKLEFTDREKEMACGYLRKSIDGGN